jgi:hypothetical protein
MVNNLALTLLALKKKILTLNTNISVVYDDTLDYKGGCIETRDQNLIENEYKKSLPILAFKHSALNKVFSHRASKQSPSNYNSGLSADVYKSWYGELILDFIFYAQHPKDIDQFSIEYHTEMNLAKIDEFNVNLTNFGLGDWNYQCIWSESLDNLQFKYDEVYFKSVAGSVRVIGWYHTFSDVIAKLNKINLSVFQYDGINTTENTQVLDEISVVKGD